MQFALHAVFREGAEAPVALHEAFSAHLMQPVLRIHLAGPLLDASGVRRGVLMIMDAPDEASARHFADASPYSEAGLYSSVSINRFDPEVGHV